MLKEIYNYIVTMPDRLYPFKSEIGGQWVRGQRSYQHAAERAFKLYGFNHIGYKLMIYRQAWHTFGSIVLIVAISAISKELFGSDRAFYVLLATAVVALLFQEFYLHPKLYRQRRAKGIADITAWLIPIAAYLLLLFK